MCFHGLMDLRTHIGDNFKSVVLTPALPIGVRGQDTRNCDPLP